MKTGIRTEETAGEAQMWARLRGDLEKGAMGVWVREGSGVTGYSVPCRLFFLLLPARSLKFGGVEIGHTPAS